ncbi:MAG: hypothetical protein J6S61_00400, partial [Elusimicrobiaceae bacterium]|nr:hypothetical protein [Elusimicrobiaceae bacterium]
MIQELKKLNKIKRNLILMWIGCIIAWIILYYFAGFGNLIPDKFYSFSMILSSVVLLILFPFLLWFYFLSQIEKTFILYVLSIIKDWKLSIPRKATVRRAPWHIEVLPPQEFVFSSILPIYGNQFHLIDAFSAENTIQSKSIAQIQYANLSKGNNKPPYVATLITIKNSKNLNSTTCFKTNNYPPKTNKVIIQEKSKIELPK